MKPRPKSHVWWITGLIALAGVLGSAGLGLNLGTLNSIVNEGGPALSRYSQPDWQDLPRLFGRLGETLVVGIWGTVINLLLAVPLTIFAARNLAPNRFAFRGSRELLNVFRALPDALIALLFTQGIGLGPMAGALAIGIHSTGFVAKALADAMERVPEGTYEGVRACGATRFQVIRFAAWPSIGREFASTTLYIADRNIRVATTLGVVGAGGIGVDLLTSLRTFNTGRAATVMVLIVGLILIVDVISNQIQRRLQ